MEVRFIPLQSRYCKALDFPRGTSRAKSRDESENQHTCPAKSRLGVDEVRLINPEEGNMRLFARILRALFVGALFVLLFSPFFVSASSQSNDSLQYLADHQDKITGGIFEEGSMEPDDSITAWSAIAFAAAGYNPDTVTTDGSPSIIDYITSRACTYETATAIERTILALSTADIDPSNITSCDLISKLDGYKDASGRIGPDIISTIFGVLAYSSIDTDIDQTTIDFIVSQQQENGGWDDGYSIETQITSQAIMALAVSGFDANSDVIMSAKKYIKSEQTGLGGMKYTSLGDWLATDSDSWSDAYTLQAIYSLGEDPLNVFWLSGGLSIRDDISSFEKNDSSYLYSRDDWGDSTPVWTTAVVIPALEGKPLGFSGNDLVSFDNSISDDKDESTADSISEESTNNTSPSTSSETTTTSNNTDDNQSSESTSIVAIPPETVSSDDNSNAVIAEEKVEVDPRVLASISENDEHDSTNSNIFDVIKIIALCIAGLVFGVLISVCTKRAIYIFLIIAGVTLASPAMAHAGRAGVVVHHSNGTQVDQCITFDEDYISGYELLRRAGLSPVLDRNFIVGIDGESGNAFDSAGASSFYWSYWQLDSNSDWIYSRAGATYSKIHDGAIDGWQLGNSTLKLSVVDFDTVCPTVASGDTTNNQPPAAPVNSSGTSITTSSDSSQDTASNNIYSTVPQKPIDQITEDNNQEISSIKGASTTKSDNNNNQHKKIVYTISIIIASIATGFIVHRYLFGRRCHPERE